MCCCDKFCFCMTVKTGSLIFAWIHAILFGFGALSCFVVNMLSVVQLLQGGPYAAQGNITAFIFSSVMSVYFVTGLTASVLLLIGISQRKPAFIKAYIVYGIITTVLLVILFIIIDCVTWFLPIPIRIAETSICLIYCFILYLHYLTYKDAVSAQNGYVTAPLEA